MNEHGAQVTDRELELWTENFNIQAWLDQVVRGVAVLRRKFPWTDKRNEVLASFLNTIEDNMGHLTAELNFLSGQGEQQEQYQ